MKRGFFAYRRYRDRKAVARTVGFFLIVTLLAVLIYASLQMRPLVERMAVTRVENTVNRIVSEAVDEAITSGKLSYDRLISFEKDADGRITAVHSNMAAFNQLQAEILDIVLARIEQVSARELSIPIGSLTGTPLLLGGGPASGCGWSLSALPRQSFKISSKRAASTRHATRSFWRSMSASASCCPVLQQLRKFPVLSPLQRPLL